MSHSHGSSTGRTLTPLVEHLHAPTELDHAKGRLKVLICAYACEPDRGSEEGAGWNWTVAAARDHDVWVLTREHDPGVQRAALAEEGVEATFEHVKLPRWLDSVRRWEHVYYSVWKVAAAVRARELHEENGFDLVHHLTWSNVWLPSPCAAVRVPFVHGPVGGGPCVPLALFPLLGAKGALKELLRAGKHLASRVNPFTRLTWQRATVIVVNNQETLRALPRRHRPRAVIRHHASVGSDVLTYVRRSSTRGGQTTRLAVMAGRLLPWKGGAAAVRAIAELDGWQLTIVGDGPDQRRLRRLAAQLGVNGRIAFVSRLARQEMLQLMASADAVLIPSFRDDSPFVGAEAQTLNVPVVAFAQGGPAEFARQPNATCFLAKPGLGAIAGLRLALVEAGAAPPPDAPPDYSVESIHRDLRAIYATALQRR